MSDASNQTSGYAFVSTVIVCERLARLEREHREIVESDGGECELMADVGWACEEIRRLRRTLHIKDGRILDLQAHIRNAQIALEYAE